MWCIILFPQIDRVLIHYNLNEKTVKNCDGITRNQFKGIRTTTNGRKALEELIDVHTFHPVEKELQIYLGVPDLTTLEAKTYNTLCIKGQSSDCRTRLRCAKCFHGRTEVSGLRLKRPISVNGNEYLYGQCMLFVSIGMQELVVIKMMRKVTANDIQQRYSFLSSRDIFKKIVRLYTCLNADPACTVITVVDAEQVFRQEQFCIMGQGLMCVNHFCWSNVYSSEIWNIRSLRNWLSEFGNEWHR